MGFFRHAAAVAWKDLRVEARTREIVYTMVFFAAMITLIASFAFVGRVESGAELASGVLWIALAFSGALGIGRAFEREREAGTMRALLLSPADRGAILLGKAVGVALPMLIVEAVVLALVIILFAAPAKGLHLVGVVLFLATIGFAVVGSVFAGMLLRARARDVLLPVVLYPIITPALIAGTRATAEIWAPTPALPQAYFWIKFLAVFDAIFLSLALWAFETVVIE